MVRTMAILMAKRMSISPHHRQSRQEYRHAACHIICQCKRISRRAIWQQSGVRGCSCLGRGDRIGRTQWSEDCSTFLSKDFYMITYEDVSENIADTLRLAV